ncbi:hypothetical protein EPO33_01405 [Patescibacteria group bacterium]|nr:MAG: hypothetical protein EPO33_01405 [Patescibacteria group bacterium]
MELINTLGIDWRILLWQAAVFLVLLGVLRKFAYGPILAALTARREKIAVGLADAEAAAQAKAEAERTRQEIVAAAQKEAGRIIADAAAASEAQRAESLLRTRAEVERLLREGDQRLAQERAAMMAGAEAELGGVVKTSLEKVLGRLVTEKDHERLLADALAAAKKGGL